MSTVESEEKAAALLFSRITPARVDEHVPIHYVRLVGMISFMVFHIFLLLNLSD